MSASTYLWVVDEFPRVLLTKTAICCNLIKRHEFSEAFGDDIYLGGTMSVRIRLKKFGCKKRPYYRIVVMDSRSPRDGKTIDELGYYHPIEAEDRQIRFDEEKAKAWLARSASPSDTVRRIFNKKGLHVT